MPGAAPITATERRYERPLAPALRQLYGIQIQVFHRIYALTTETRPERPEEGADVLDQRHRLLEGREVAARRHVAPMLDVVRLLGEAAHGGDDVIGEGRYPCGHLDASRGPL